jgi:hypothetical protein
MPCYPKEDIKQRKTRFKTRLSIQTKRLESQQSVSAEREVKLDLLVESEMCSALPLERSVFELLNETAVIPLIFFLRTMNERNDQLKAYDVASCTIEESMLTLYKHGPFLHRVRHMLF